MEAALRQVHDEFERDWPLVIGGERVTIGRLDRQLRPLPQAQRRVGRVAKAGAAEAERALDAAWTAFPDWSRWQPDERARLLLKAAALMRAQKHVFSATMVYEAGKTWPEADADTAEAIDFLEYYAREAMRLAQPAAAAAPGRRGQRADLPAARRGRGHPAVELSAGDHVRHDRGGAGDRQHGHPEAGRA